jgi:hypothetical protein
VKKSFFAKTFAKIKNENFQFNTTSPYLPSPWSLGLLLLLVIASSTSVDHTHPFTGSFLVPRGFLHYFIHS